MEAFDDIKNELDGMAPILSKLPKTNAFTVKEGYFDELPTMVMNRIQAKKARKRFDLSWLLQPRWAATMAVCTIAVVFGSFILVKNINSNHPVSTAKNIAIPGTILTPDTNKSVEQVLTEDEDTANQLASTATQKNTRDSKKHADKKAIEEYILDNVDESSLIDAL